MNDQAVEENLNISNAKEINYNITYEEVQPTNTYVNFKFNEKKYMNVTPEDANLLIFYRIPKCASTTMMILLKK